MPQRRLIAPRVVPALVAALLAGTPLAAQRTVVGADVNSASETEVERAPHLFASAGVAPRHRFGLTIHGMASRVEGDVRLDMNVSGDAWSTGYRTTGSLFYGLTSRITVGAFLSGVQDVRTNLDELYVPTPDPEGGPTRQGIRTPIGSTEIGAYARAGLWNSATGATRIAANVVVDDAADQDPATTAGLALQHRLGRVTLHLVPSLRFSDGYSGGGEPSLDASGRLGAAASIAATRRLGLSLEMLREGFDYGTTDAAVGARWHFGRIAVDAGFRGMVDHDTIVRDAKRYSATVATHLVF